MNEFVALLHARFGDEFCDLEFADLWDQVVVVEG